MAEHFDAGKTGRRVLVFCGQRCFPIGIIRSDGAALAGVPAKETTARLRIHVQVGIDIAGMNDRALGIDDVFRLPVPQNVLLRPCRRDRVARHRHGAPRNDRPALIHRQETAILDDEIAIPSSGHGPGSFLMTSSGCCLAPGFEYRHVDLDT